MDEFKVDIKFPRKTDADPNIVTIVGAEDNVADAKDRLLNLEEEYVSVVHWNLIVTRVETSIWLQMIKNINRL